MSVPGQYSLTVLVVTYENVSMANFVDVRGCSERMAKRTGEREMRLFAKNDRPHHFPLAAPRVPRKLPRTPRDPHGAYNGLMKSALHSAIRSPTE